MRFFIKPVLLLSIISLAIIPANIYAEEEEKDFDRIFYNGFDNDGYFVTIPTYAGNYLGMVIGAIPSALVAGTFHAFNAQDYTTNDAALYTWKVFTMPIGFLVGVPFKFIKSVFWDSPKYVIGGIRNESPYPNMSAVKVRESNPASGN